MARIKIYCHVFSTVVIIGCTRVSNGFWMIYYVVRFSPDEGTDKLKSAKRWV